MKANAQKIGDGVCWIGVLDWDLKSYHGYTLDGTTYNAHIIFGENHVAVIDNAYPGKTQNLWHVLKMLSHRKAGRCSCRLHYSKSC